MCEIRVNHKHIIPYHTTHIHMYVLTLIVFGFKFQKLFLLWTGNTLTGRPMIPQHHGEGLIDLRNRGGKGGRSTGPRTRRQMGAKATTDPNLLRLQCLAVVSDLDIFGTGSKNFQNFTTDEALEFRQPILIFVRGHGDNGGNSFLVMRSGSFHGRGNRWRESSCHGQECFLGSFLFLGGGGSRHGTTFTASSGGLGRGWLRSTGACRTGSGARSTGSREDLLMMRRQHHLMSGIHVGMRRCR